MSAAQRAMAVAMIYPEAPHGGDRKGKRGSSLPSKLDGSSNTRFKGTAASVGAEGAEADRS
jgi:hypothetical protein